MKAVGAKKQTVFLTGVNAVVRALGLLMRVMLSRLLGAEIMGIAELAQGVHMLAITPLTSGLPLAISRMTARAPKDEKQKPLLAGVFLVRVASAALIPALLLFSPLLARWMGDVRVLPSLWFSAPCILILGYSAAFNGYCYGMERSLEPALLRVSELWLRLHGCDSRAELEWEDINLQDLVEEARADLYRAQAEKQRRELEK